VPWKASAVLGVAAFGVLFFHRDPDRETPPSGAVAPADGRVAVIREEDDGRLRLGTYMRGRDVHVNRAPTDGVVRAVEHEPGANKLAFRKESERNERLRFSFAAPESESGSLHGDHDENWEAEQIAGAFARRTYSYVEPGETVERGQRIGHISFGSRFDLVFPPAYDREDLTVDLGHRVYAGETVVPRPREAVRESVDAVKAAEDEPAAAV